MNRQHDCGAFVSQLTGLFARYGLMLVPVPDGQPIPGSFWGDSEAGLIGQAVYARTDTPLHSVLHEACHVLCMGAQRRDVLHTDAGGDYAEEDAVCYLQIVLAGHVGITAEAICDDMDAWGYTFRLGSAHAWYTQDADDARDWLVRHGLLQTSGEPSWKPRAD